MQQVIRLDHPLTYTGDQLRSLWIYETFGVSGDAIAVFRGPCDVQTEGLVDAEDRRAGATIVAADMLHFIIEHFGDSLDRAVLRQRLFLAVIKDHIDALLPDRRVRRDGDDLFVEAAKLTVSIATISPVSSLIHTGINIDAGGAPVEAIGLQDLGLDAVELARALAEAYVDEIKSARFAATKVRGVR